MDHLIHVFSSWWSILGWICCKLLTNYLQLVAAIRSLLKECHIQFTSGITNSDFLHYSAPRSCLTIQRLNCWSEPNNVFALFGPLQQAKSACFYIVCLSLCKPLSAFIYLFHLTETNQILVLFWAYVFPLQEIVVKTDLIFSFGRFYHLIMQQKKQHAALLVGLAHLLKPKQKSPRV